MNFKLGAVALLASAIALAAPAHAAVVFNTLGAGDSYNANAGYTIGLSYSQGIGFSPTSSGFLDLVEIGAGHTGADDQWLTLTLHADDGGQPGSILETMTALVTQTFGEDSVLTSFIAAGTSYLDASLTYWLIATSQSGVNTPWNYNSIGATGLRASGPDSLAGPWTVSDSTLAAARISVSEVPLPAAFPLFAAGAAMVGAAARRRKKR